jgi:hypothetical protein
MSRLRVSLIIMAFLTIGILAMPAKSLADEAGDTKELRRLYTTAVEKRGDAIARAMSAAESILTTHPDHPLATAYKGSLLTLTAAESWLPWAKLRYVNAGIDTMDDAIVKAQSVRDGAGSRAEVFVICGLTDAALPSMFRRGPNARKEIETAITLPDFANIDAPTQARVLALAAAYAKKDGDASRAEDLLARARDRDAAEAMKAYHDNI